MDDEQSQHPRSDADVDTPQGGTDPTPAEDAATPATEGIAEESGDHSAWMRPAVGEERRTSEIVGALAPESTETEDLPDEPIDVFEDTAPVTPDEAETADGSTEEPNPLHAAAAIGAAAAQRRLCEPDSSGAHAARPGSRPMAWLPWLAGALVAALVAFAVVHSLTDKPVVVITPTPTPSATTPPAVTEADLLTAKDAEAITPKQGWTVASTLSRLTPTSPKVICQPNTTGQPNPTITRQRTLTTTSTRGLAALHQVDNFASVADASKAFEARATNLAACDNEPLWIHSNTAVGNAGDAARLVTVARQDDIAEYHTVLLLRTGTTVHALDVTQANQPAPAANVLNSAAAAVNRQCARSTGRCATQPKVAEAIPAATEPMGWLSISDIPRVSPRAGLWTVTDASNVVAPGSECENMTLASVAGPTQREQRTYQMTQDNAAPRTYGMDEVLFTFKDARQAAQFANTLASNLKNCPSRLATAKVSESAQVTSSVGRKKVAGATLLVQQSLGGTETARFRTGVAVVDNKVIYLVNNPSTSYDLGSAKFQQVTVRAAQRATQLP
ncbi:hypothetical protein [Luteococcus sp.]|uniref:hypothetical protein n=1 Tax=Luteococcus sp. TaxID=1969402 RepID=UPI003736BD7D